LNKIRYFLLISLLLSLFISVHAQDKERVGLSQNTSQQGGFYNFGEEGKVNIEVSIWGYVKFPGKYIIPQGSSFVDLISFAGGPLAEANLEDIRLLRSQNDTLKVTKDELIKLNYNDLFWEKEVMNTKNRNIVLKPGDVFVFPGGPRYYFRDNLTLILSFISTAVTITVLMVTIFKQ
jgi:hypothetical protein